MLNDHVAAETWLIVGASSAIARSFARQVALKGANIILVGRDLEDLTATAADCENRFRVKVFTYEMDITSYGGHGALLDFCKKATPNRINLFVCVGWLPNQSVIESNPCEIQQVINVNFTAVSVLLLSLITLLTQQPGARVIVFGSVAGDRGRLSNFCYGAAKAGLHAFVSGYRALCHKHGISVTLMKPGFMDTAMTYGMPNLFLVASPQACAKKCWIAAKKQKSVVYFPSFWALVMFIIRMIPTRIFKTLSL